MTSICTNSKFPTKAELLAIFGAIHMPDLPELPTFPKPFFGNVTIPEVAVEHWIQEIINNYMSALIGKIAEIITMILGAIPFPNIPNWDFSITDFMTGQIDRITAAIRLRMAEFADIFGSIHIPEIAVWHIVQDLYAQAVKSAIDFIMSKIQPILDLINSLHLDPFPGFPAIPTLPQMPTFQSIVDMLMAIINEKMAEIAAKIAAGIDAASAMLASLGSLHFPGFPFDITLPNIGNFLAPAMDVVKMATGIVSELLMMLLKMVTKFITDLIDIFINILGLIPLKFPTICITDGALDISFA